MKGRRLHLLLHALTHVAAEARGMISVEPEVFVHVKERHLAPVHLADGDEFLEKLNLRITRGQNRRGTALVGNHAAQIFIHLNRSSGRHVILTGKHTHRQRIDLKGLDGFCTHECGQGNGAHRSVNAKGCFLTFARASASLRGP